MVVLICLWLMLAYPCAGLATAGADEMTAVTILYDNYVHLDGTRADWGFSCLIKGAEKTILFDTGAKPDILLHNFEKMGVDTAEVDLVVVSHDHWDHTGGLAALLKRNHDVTVYAPKSFPGGFFRQVEDQGARTVRIDQPLEIADGVYSTGEMGGRIREQALILEGGSGGILITGCSHPGIVEIIEAAKKILKKDIHTVLGGFHLLEKSTAEMDRIINRFKDLGVRRVAPSHCTGDDQIAAFKKAYGDHYIRIGTGKVLEF